MTEIVKTRRVRGIVVNRAARRPAFIAQVNNRVAPGTQTIMLPGGEVPEGVRPMEALQKHILEQFGLSDVLDDTNCRFVCSRTYSFDKSQSEEVEVIFYRVDLDHPVPVNNCQDQVISVDWMDLATVDRLIATDSAGWGIMLGAKDALVLALDPSRTRAVSDGGREVSRRDGGVGPDAAEPTAAEPIKPVPLPYGGA